MLFFIYAIIGMQVGDSFKLRICVVLLGCSQTFWRDKNDDVRSLEKENEDDGDTWFDERIIVAVGVLVSVQ